VSAIALSADGPADPGPSPAAGRPPAALRLATVATGLALSVAVVRESLGVRVFEAWLSGHLVPLVTGIRAGAYHASPELWFALGRGRYLGLQVSPECTIDELIVPFILGTTWTIWHRGRLRRPLAALVVAIAMLLAVNQARLLGIVMLTEHFGPKSGFYWGHTFLGSLVTIFGVVLTFFVYVLMSARRAPLSR
jgi:exosortase/archaeosortase family protein